MLYEGIIYPLCLALISHGIIACTIFAVTCLCWVHHVGHYYNSKMDADFLDFLGYSTNRFL